MNIVNSGRVLLRNASDLLSQHNIGTQAFAALKNSVNFLAKQIINTGAVFKLPASNLSHTANHTSTQTSTAEEDDEFSLENLTKMNRTQVDYSDPASISRAQQEQVQNTRTVAEPLTPIDENPRAEDAEIHNTLIEHRDDITALLPNSPHLMAQLDAPAEHKLTTAFKHALTFAKGLEHQHLSTQKDSVLVLQETIKLIGSHLPHISTPLERTHLLNQIHKLSLEKGLPADLKQTLQQINQQKGQLPLAMFLNKPIPPLNE